MNPSSSNHQRFFLKKRNFLIIIAIFVCISLASIVALANDNTVIVETSVLNVRQGPGLSHDVITTVHEDERLHVIERQNEWMKIRLDDNQVGWVASWLVYQPEITTESQQTAVITGDYVNIRSQATTDSEILGVVEKDSEVNVVYQDGNWSQIVYNDQVAWVSSYYISFVNGDASEVPSSEASNIVTVLDTESNVRSTPSTSSDVVGRAPAGATYTYLATVNGWHKIQYDENTVGYIADFLVEFNGQIIPDETADVPQESSNTPIADSTIVIDAGHGGHDPGAVNQDMYEKHLTLNTALKLQHRLASTGANIIMTRSDDQYISLAGRVSDSLNSHADAFISLHYDAVATPNSMNGTTTYYYSDSDQGLAEAVNSSLASNSPLSNNGIRVGDYYVLRNNSRPSLLLELGYMNSDTDLEYIFTDQYQDQVADAIYQGLITYFE
ncbi:MAG TPA: N-acetylmuramoyl-L-alanine amidase [Alloiococcus sp.]|nr:N-acetylmuramoyl-L-alanine amidase [Alloiococcus sp.]